MYPGTGFGLWRGRYSAGELTFSAYLQKSDNNLREFRVVSLAERDSHSQVLT
jgi:hypothetical protein